MVSNSTFSGNYVLGPVDLADGGGIAGSAGSGGTMTTINSTFYENVAGSEGEAGSNGGGIAAGGSTLTVISSTFTGNGADCCGGSIAGSASLKNTILAVSSSGGNCSGTITDGEYNISDDDTCDFTATGSLNNTNPKLDPNGLQNNGGPTETIALVIGSPAIDVIPLTSCTNAAGQRLTTDQRGESRPGAGETTCDIGAYEIQE
jgi:hypothetical protein